MKKVSSDSVHGSPLDFKLLCVVFFLIFSLSFLYNYNEIAQAVLMYLFACSRIWAYVFVCKCLCVSVQVQPITLSLSVFVVAFALCSQYFIELHFRRILDTLYRICCFDFSPWLFFFLFLLLSIAREHLISGSDWFKCEK